MVRAATRASAIVIAVAALAGCGGGGEPAPPHVVMIVQDDAELLYPSDEQVAATLDDLQDLGVEWVRISAFWTLLAPERDVRNWAPLDRAVAMVRERGMQVALDLAFGPPPWATIADDFGPYVSEVAQRYPGTVAFTVWNEPNHPTFLDPQWQRAPGGGWEPAAPHLYRRMLSEAVPRIRAAAPDALVLIGGTSSLGEDRADSADDRISPLRFVRELACVDERLQPLDRAGCDDFAPLPGDGFAHHPYSGELPPGEHDAADPSSVRVADLDRLRDLLDRLHAAGRIEADLPLYLTEYGYQTNPPDPTWQIAPAQAARWESEAEEIARREPSVRSVAHFLHRDAGKRDGTKNPWGDFQTGLVLRDGSPKPMHAALALPLVAHRAGASSVRFWGLVRPGDGPLDARVEIADAAGGWETLFDVETDAEGVFERTVEVDPAATFRLVSGDRAGIALDGAR